MGDAAPLKASGGSVPSFRSTATRLRPMTSVLSSKAMRRSTVQNMTATQPMVAGVRLVHPRVAGRFGGTFSSECLGCEQLPAPRDTLQLVFAAIKKLEPRTRDNVSHGSGHQDLARLGQRLDPGGDIDP
jgi:hypothetical protein